MNTKPSFRHLFKRPESLLGLGLIMVWLVVLLGLHQNLSLQGISWLTFLAIVITPGYLLGDLVAWRLHLDGMERLALAFPLGVVVMIPAGMPALVWHLTLHQLIAGWVGTVLFLILAWLVHGYRVRWCIPQPAIPWGWDEIALGLITAVSFLLLLPTFTLYQIDGDTYSFLAFVRDALQGGPLNLTEPIFGTNLETGVRMAFNQYYPLIILQTYFSGLDPVELSAAGSRAMIALWVLLAAYMLGKAAKNGDRRFGLFMVAIQTLIYCAAPFLRTDNVSTFFFERVNTDKFLVSVIFLPVLFALLLRYLRQGERAVYGTAVFVTLSVSVIHPLVALMLALGTAALGGIHLLCHLRQRLAWKRVAGLATLVLVAMFLPFIQFLIVRQERPMAPTFPTTFNGWQVGPEMLPTFPFFFLQGQDWYGPAPDLQTVQAAEAATTNSPFLIWRFISNLHQRRILLFDLNRYVVDFSYILEPTYLLAFACLLLLLPRLRRDVAVQYTFGVTLAVLLVMYNPLFTPILGKLTVPWLLWRFHWMLPYALCIALGLDGGLGWLAGKMAHLSKAEPSQPLFVYRIVSWQLIILAVVLAWPAITTQLQNIQQQAVLTVYNKVSLPLMERIADETEATGPVLVMAPQTISVAIPAFAANANVVGHRALTMSEMFPAAQQVEALQRLLDQNQFFSNHYLTAESARLLNRYQPRFVLAPTGSDLDTQLRLFPGWFTWLFDDQGFSLYETQKRPFSISLTLQANTALQNQEWQTAQRLYLAALQTNPQDYLALAGLAEVQQFQGQFAQAAATWQQLAQVIPAPGIYFRLGQLYGALGDTPQSMAAYAQAQELAPDVPHFHVAYGDVCHQVGLDACAQTQYETAVSSLHPSDTAAQQTELAVIWEERGDAATALSLYQSAVALNPSEQNQYLLMGAYLRQGNTEAAGQIVAALRAHAPTEPRHLVAEAALLANQGRVDEAIALYQKAIWWQYLWMQDTSPTRLALAQTLLANGRFADAHHELTDLLNLQPHAATTYLLLGNLYQHQGQSQTAVLAYQQALSLDPTSIASYNALTTQYQQQAVPPDENLGLFQTATTRNPQNASLLLGLGDQLRRYGDLETAVSAYQQAIIALQPDPAAPFSPNLTAQHNLGVAYSRLASLYDDLGQRQTALAYYRAAVAIAPNEAPLRVVLADALRTRGETAEAETLYRTAITLNPGYAPAYSRLADLLQAHGETAAAYDWLQQGITAVKTAENTPQQTRALLSLGRFAYSYTPPLLNIGSDDLPPQWQADLVIETEIVLNTYTEAVETDNNLAAVKALAFLYQQMGQPEQAITLYQSAIQQTTVDNASPVVLAQFYKGLGDLFLLVEQPQSAVQAYQQAIALNSWLAGPHIGLGRALQAQGEHHAAIVQFETAVSLAPGSASAHLSLAAALETQDQPDRALQIYQQTAQAHPGDLAAVLALAEAYKTRSQWAEAEAVYRRVLEISPGSPAGYADLAALLISQNRPAEAEPLLWQAIEIDQTSTQAALQLGALLARYGRYEQAISVYQQTIEATPHNWQLYSGLSRAYHAIGQYDLAITSLEQAASYRPDDPAPFLQLAALYREQNRPHLAEDTLLLALDLYPGEATVRLGLADLYQSWGLAEETVLQLQQAIAEDPTNLTVQIAYANELRRQGLAAQAEILYQELELAETADSATYRALATARLEQGDTSAALSLMERAIALSPDEPANWLLQGRIQTSLGQLEAALVSFLRATELQPGAANAWHALAQAVLVQGQQQEAEHLLQQALTLEPTYLPAYETLIHLRLETADFALAAQLVEEAQLAVPGSPLPDHYAALYLSQQRQWDKAIASLETAVSKAPGLIDSYLLLADLQTQRGYWATALHTYQQAAQVAPGEWRVYAGLGQVYAALGDREQAIGNWQTAVHNAPAEPAAAAELATLYQQQNQFETAESVLQTALIANPGNITLLSTLAAQMQAIGQPEEALQQLETAVAAHPTAINALLPYAQQLLLFDQQEETSAVYQQIALLPLYTATDYRTMAAAYHSQGRTAQALVLVSQAVNMWPQEAANWLLQGQLQLAAGQTAQALDSLQRATELGPNEAQNWQVLGDGLLEVGEYERAAGALETAVLLQPTSLPAYELLLQVYLQLNEMDKAASLLQTAQTLLPGDYRVHLMAARWHVDQEQWDEAAAELTLAQTAVPGLTAPLLAQGDLAQQLGDEEAALVWYETAVSLRPGESQPYQSASALLQKTGHYTEAIILLEQGLANRPADSGLLLAQGQALRAVGQFQQAEQVLTKAAALEAQNGRIWAVLANLYRAWGKPALAIAAYQDALTRRPNEASYYLELAHLYVAQADPAQAAVVLQAGLPLADEPAGLYAALSHHYLQQAQPVLALATLQDGVVVLAEQPELAQAFANYYTFQGQFDEAETWLETAVSLWPDDVNHQLALAAFYLERGRVADARLLYEMLLAQNGNNVAVLMAGGQFYARLGEIETAVSVYTHTVNLEPSSLPAYLHLATLYQQQAMWAEAEASYQAALAATPPSSSLFVAYGTFLAQQGQADEGLAWFDRAWQLAPTSETLMARANAYRVLGQSGAATADLQAALQLNPGLIAAHINLATLYQQDGNTAGAWEMYQQVVELAPGTAVGYLGLADLAYQQGNVSAAREYAYAAHAAQPGLAAPYLTLGRIASQQEDWTAAESSYRLAVGLAPLATEAYVGLATAVYQQTADLDQSLAWLWQAYGVGVNRGSVYRAMGDLALQDGQSAQAATFYQQAVNAEPGVPDSYWRLADIYLSEGLPTVARQSASTALVLASQEPRSHIAWGNVAVSLGDVETAEQSYRTAMGLDNQAVQGHLALIGLYRGQGRLAEAISVYQQAIERQPANLSLWLGLAETYTQLEQYEVALAALAEAETMNPASPDVWLVRGDVYWKWGDGAMTTAAYEQAHGLAPDQVAPAMRLGTVYLQRGDWGLAEQWARQAVAIAPKEGAAYELLGDVLMQNGRFDEAIAAYETAMRLNPRLLTAFDNWIRLQYDVRLRPSVQADGVLSQSLAAIAAGPEAGLLWAQLAQGLGEWKLDGPTDGALGHLEAVLGADPAYYLLYARCAYFHEQQLNGRSALQDWYRFLYAARTQGGDTWEAQAHINWLLQTHMTQPTDGASVSGAVEIVGTATADSFQFYKVEYQAISAGQDEWVAVGEVGTVAVENGRLAMWDMAVLPPGQYRLRLTVVDVTGNYGPIDEIVVIVNRE